MTRFLKCSLILVVALIINPSVASGASIGPGKSCNKLKSTWEKSGFVYTCIKVKGKLVWDKGTRIIGEVTPTPKAITYLTTPPPNMGEVTTKIECLKSQCSYNGPIPEGSIIVVKSLKSEWSTYGATNGISDISFKLTSPTGKVTISQKYPLPYQYDSSSWTTAEIGIWSVQIAGWQGDQQTVWSSPATVNVKVLPQSANGLKPCSQAMETALQNGANAASTLMREIESAWNQREVVLNKYRNAQIFQPSYASQWLSLVMQWDDLLRQKYKVANGLYNSYDEAKKTCNTSVEFPTYVEDRS